MSTFPSNLDPSNLGVVAAYGYHLTKQKECEGKIAHIQSKLSAVALVGLHVISFVLSRPNWSLRRRT
jgi:hypothetical protein